MSQEKGRPPPHDRPPRASLFEDTGEIQLATSLEPPKPASPKAPGFFESSKLDPWNDVTPADLPGEEHEIVQDGPTPEPVLEPAGPRETEGEVAIFSGDGPLAAPVDAPARERPRIPVTRSSSQAAREGFAGAISAPLVVTRHVAPRAQSQAGGQVGVPGRALMPRRPSGIVTPEHPRRYPKMRALLKSPERVPHGSEPLSRAKRPPVPGTFFPAAKREKEPPPQSAAPVELDEMLATMAEGLLIGEDASGHTEVRVTLRDEFFAGTELRITAGGGKVSALLLPPDRGTYLELNANVDELRGRLETRGLRVQELRVLEP